MAPLDRRPLAKPPPSVSPRWQRFNPQLPSKNAAAPAGVLAAGVSAGRYSTQVMSSDGALWVFGLDGCAASGQLPPRPSAYLPRRIGAERFGGARVAAVSTGYVFWVAADEYGRVYTCGTGDDGYAGTLPNRRAPNAAGELGRGGPPGAPGRVEGVARAAAVAAGREHALVVTRGGDVYSWGGGGRGDRAIGRAGRYDRPGLVKGALAGRAARLVAAGEVWGRTPAGRRRGAACGGGCGAAVRQVASRVSYKACVLEVTP